MSFHGLLSSTCPPPNPQDFPHVSESKQKSEQWPSKALCDLPCPSALSITESFTLLIPSNQLLWPLCCSSFCQACSLCLNALSTVVYMALPRTLARFLLSVPLCNPVTLPSNTPFPLSLICFPLSLRVPHDLVSTCFIVLLLLRCKFQGGKDFSLFLVTPIWPIGVAS